MTKKNVKIILTVFLAILAIAALWIINAFSGNPVSRMMAERQYLSYFENTYHQEFKVYGSEYNFKIPAYIFTLGPAEKPEIRFDTAFYSMGLADEYGGILAAEKLSEDVSRLLEPVYGDLNYEIRAKEDPLTGYGGEVPDYFETDPSIRVLKNHYILEMRWMDPKADQAGVRQIAADAERQIETRLPYTTPNLIINAEAVPAEGAEPIRIEGRRFLFPTFENGEPADAIVYRNSDFGFSFILPASWKGYTIVAENWEGRAITGPKQGQVTEQGKLLRIRHPQWTVQVPRQDIPIMIFTLAQWEALQEEAFSVGAAPIPPSEYGRNAGYVFALPARYNYAFPPGFEEVERIITGNPLKPFASNDPSLGGSL
jgi:hypothetical protein